MGGEKMKKKKFIALLLVISLVASMSVSAFAADIQPRSSISYGNTTLKSGGTYYLKLYGGNFTISANKTVSISYTPSKSGVIRVYFYNSDTGSATRVYSSYTPSSMVTGYFYMYNSSSTSVTVSGVSVSY